MVLVPGFGAVMAVGAVFSFRRRGFVAGGYLEPIFGGCFGFFVRAAFDVTAVVFGNLKRNLVIIYEKTFIYV